MSICANKSYAINAYNHESTPEQYAVKEKLHYNFQLEGKRLVENSQWSKRINELAELIPGCNIIELGCAEGLLCTKLSKTKSKVTGIDISAARINQAESLKEILIQKNIVQSNISFQQLDIRSQLEGDILSEFDCFVACRVIYHFRDYNQLDKLMKKISTSCEHIFLLGDQTKAKMYYSFGPTDINPVPFFFYASIDGMYRLLKSNGYSVSAGFTSFGDPYAVGSK